MNIGQQICIGHLTNDDIWQSEYGIKYKNQMGGACLYSALGASIWKSKVVMITYMGKSYNTRKFFVKTQKRGINVCYVKQKIGEGIKLVVKYEKEGKRQFIPKRKSGDYVEWAPKAVDIPLEILEQAKVVHIAPLPLDIQLGILDKVYSKNRIVTLDPDIEDIVPEKFDTWKCLFNKVDYLLVSEMELEKFFKWNIKWSVKKNSDIKMFCEKFHVKNIVVKKAEKGAIGITVNGDIYNIPAYQVKVKDCTGAGDAFAGGFGYGIQKCGNMKEAMLYGSISSSFAIEGIGISGLYNVTKDIAYERYKMMKGMKE